MNDGSEDVTLIISKDLTQGDAMLPKLPLGISTFRKLRKSQYLYVDKTKYAYDLIEEPKS